MGGTSVSQAEAGPVVYVLKMYPRFSETFIVNELLAHQAAGVGVEIVSLRPPVDGRFHESLAAVVDAWTARADSAALQARTALRRTSGRCRRARRRAEELRPPRTSAPPTRA